jgi:hypothetical protein
MLSYVELALSWYFKNARGRDDKCLFNSTPFHKHTMPTITVTSPDCGPSESTLAKEYIYEGGGRLPSLHWQAPEDITSKVKEWLVFNEDVDSPLAVPIVHG